MVEIGQGPQQCAFARPAAAQQGDEFALVDVEVQPVQHAAAGKATRQIPYADSRIGVQFAKVRCHDKALFWMRRTKPSEAKPSTA